MYVWRDGQFRLDHHLDTQQATDVEATYIAGTVLLAVATGTLSHSLHTTTPHEAVFTGSSGVSIFQWSPDVGLFVFNTTLSSAGALRVESVPSTGYHIITCIL